MIRAISFFAENIRVIVERIPHAFRAHRDRSQQFLDCFDGNDGGGACVVIGKWIVHDKESAPTTSADLFS